MEPANSEGAQAPSTLKEIGSDLVPAERMTPGYLGTFIAAEIEKWAKIIKADGTSLE